MDAKYTRKTSTRNVKTATSRTRRRKAHKKNSTYIAILMALTFLFSVFIGTGATASKVSETECYVVTHGDTLWELASGCNTRGDDVRNVMDDIMELNHMKSAELHAGEIIVLPIY